MHAALCLDAASSAPTWASLPHDRQIKRSLCEQTWSSILPKILLPLYPWEALGLWDRTRGEEGRRNMKVYLLPLHLALQRKSMQKSSQLLSGNVNISGLQGHLPGQQFLPTVVPFNVCLPGESLGATGHRCNAGGEGSPVESPWPSPRGLSAFPLQLEAACSRK